MIPFDERRPPMANPVPFSDQGHFKVV